MDKNTNRQLVDYYKRNLAKGYDEDSLKFALINQGNSRALVEKAIFEAKKELSMETPKVVREEKPEITITEEPVEPPKKSWFKRFFGLD